MALTPSQRGQDMPGGRPAQLASSQLKRAHRRGATRATPWRGSGASRGGCDASATQSRGDLPRPRRPAATPWHVRWPRVSSLPAQRAPAALGAGASHRPSAGPRRPRTVGRCAWSNGGAPGGRAHPSRAAAPLPSTPSTPGSGPLVAAHLALPCAPKRRPGRRRPRAAGGLWPRRSS